MPNRAYLMCPQELRDATDTAVPLNAERRDTREILQGQGAPAALANAPNLALVYQRYLPAHDLAEDYSTRTPCGLDLQDAWRANERNASRLAEDWCGRGVLDWFSRLGAGALPLAEVHTRREQAFRGALGASSLTKANFVNFGVRWRAAVGIATPAPVENAGWVFDPTYGVPVLPAPSLKGLARHFLEEEVKLEGRVSEVLRPENHQAGFEGLLARCVGDTASPADCTAEQLARELFGTAEGEGRVGLISMLDALPIAGPPWFEVDVLTPHHPKYYAGADQVDERTVPIFFVALKRDVGFRTLLGPTSRGRKLPEEESGAALAVAEGLLSRAAREWGVGARTGAGYGRMKPLEEAQ